MIDKARSYRVAVQIIRAGFRKNQTSSMERWNTGQTSRVDNLLGIKVTETVIAHEANTASKVTVKHQIYGKQLWMGKDWPGLGKGNTGAQERTAVGQALISEQTTGSSELTPVLTET